MIHHYHNGYGLTHGQITTAPTLRRSLTTRENQSPVDG